MQRSVFSNKTLWLVLIGIFTLSFYALHKEQYIHSQLAIFIQLNHTMQAIPATVWENLTDLGDAAILIPILSFFVIIHPRILAALLGAIPVAAILGRSGKAFFAIPRPASVIEHDQFYILSETLVAHNSYPSGHSITIFTAMFAIIIVHLKDNYRPNKLLLVGVAMAGVIIGFSRIAVGAHWPLDVVAGCAVAYLAVLSGEFLSRRYVAWWSWIIMKPYAFACVNLLFPLLLLMMMANNKLALNAVVMAAFFVSISVSAYISVKAFRHS